VPFTNPVVWSSGSQGEYQWLTSGQHDLGVLLRLLPRMFLGKYVAVTSIDSGPLILETEDLLDGWQSRNDIAYSPKVQSVEKLQHGQCAGFDEWYVFEDPPELGRVIEENIFETELGPGKLAVFVNYGGFGFHYPGIRDLTDLFWKQLEWIRPELYVADGDLLSFVSRDRVAFEAVLQILSDKSSSIAGD
jgi:hypothetical protein